MRHALCAAALVCAALVAGHAAGQVTQSQPIPDLDMLERIWLGHGHHNFAVF